MSDSERVFQAMTEIADASPTSFRTLSDEEQAAPVTDGMVRVGFTDADGKTGEFEMPTDQADRIFGQPGPFSISHWTEGDFRPKLPPLLPKMAPPPRPGDVSPDPAAEVEELWKAISDQADRLDEVAGRLAEMCSFPTPDPGVHRRHSALMCALDLAKARLAAGHATDAGDAVRDALVFAEYLGGEVG